MRLFFKLLALFLSPMSLGRDRKISILMYHRVTGDSGYEFDIDFSDFGRQLHYLKEHRTVISLSESVNNMKMGAQDGHAIVITFDDAYEDFYTRVFPLLKRLGIPATLFVPTGFIDEPSDVPVSSMNNKAEILAPCTWDMLREMNRCDLVTLAAHSHTHREFTDLDPESIADEVAGS